MKEFHQHGPTHTGYGMANDFRSAKEFIYQASAVNSTTGRSVRVESDGSVTVFTDELTRRLGGIPPTGFYRIQQQL